MTQKLALVGGGHSHLYLLHRIKELQKAGAEVTLVAPGPFHYYSGMGPGLLSKMYTENQVRFDVKSITESNGGIFKQGAVQRIDPQKKVLFLESGESIAYDLVSFNVGTFVPQKPGGSGTQSVSIKPIANFTRLQKIILQQIKTGTPKILVIGGGPAGVETAGSIHRLVQDAGGKAEIRLASSARLLPSFPDRAAKFAEASLRKRGIHILSNCRVALEDKITCQQNGKTFPYDIAVMATGAQQTDIFKNSPLSMADDGSMVVNDYLQSVDDPHIFGVGDCITIDGTPLDRVGVYAVRQAPVLFENILAALRNKPMQRFQKQRSYMLIFNLGDGRGIYVRGATVICGRWMFKWKDRIDRKFMQRYQ